MFSVCLFVILPLGWVVLAVSLWRVSIWSGKVSVCLSIELALFLLSEGPAVAAVLYLSSGVTAVPAVGRII